MSGLLALALALLAASVSAGYRAASAARDYGLSGAVILAMAVAAAIPAFLAGSAYEFNRNWPTRKSAVVALLEAGCTVKEVASITGQSMQIIEHYGKRYDQRSTAERAMEKFENNAATVLQMPAKASG